MSDRWTLVIAIWFTAIVGVTTGWELRKHLDDRYYASKLAEKDAQIKRAGTWVKCEVSGPVALGSTITTPSPPKGATRIDIYERPAPVVPKPAKPKRLKFDEPWEHDGAGEVPPLLDMPHDMGVSCGIVPGETFSCPVGYEYTTDGCPSHIRCIRKPTPAQERP